MLTCEGTVIPTQDEMELLGVTLDNKLKFEGQIRKICRKVSQQVAVLSLLKKILPLELRIDIYRSFIAPHFNYCSESWHHCGKRGSGKPQAAQTHVTREGCNVIYNTIGDAPVSRYRRPLKI